MALARDLGCHMFREISVKESMNDASEVFEDLWREFSRLSPRSPSTSQRRKYSCKLQDKISVLDSEACTCASEALKTISHSHSFSHANEVLVTTLTSTLKRQGSLPSTSFPSARQIRQSLMKHSSTQNDLYSHSRNIPSIPEHIKEMEEEHEEERIGSPKPHRSRKNAIFSVANHLHLSLPKAFGFENSSAPPSVAHSPPCHELFSLSSMSSSSGSLNSLTENVETTPDTSARNSKSSVGRVRSSSDASSLRRKNSDKSNQLTFLYHEHCQRHRNRHWDAKKCHQQFSHTFNPLTSPLEVKGFC